MTQPHWENSSVVSKEEGDAMEKEEDGKTRGMGATVSPQRNKKKWFILKPNGSDCAQE